MEQDGDQKRGHPDRQELISWALSALGTESEIAKKTGVTESRIRNWIYEGRINRHIIPDLIKVSRRKKVILPWALLVQPRKRVLDWSTNRIRLEEIFIVLGGQSFISGSLGLTNRAVKDWGYRETIPESHLIPFLRFCQKQFRSYTGYNLSAYEYITTEQDLDIFKLHSLFRDHNLVFQKRSRKQV